MKHAVSREIFDYWNDLRGSRTSPERGDIDPATIRHSLAYTFILEVGGTGGERLVTIRLSGTRLNALFRSELKSRPFHGLWSVGQAAAADALIDTVLNDRRAVVAGVRGTTVFGETIDLELLLLPLRHHGRTHARMLGSLAAITVPTWIGLHPITGLDLLTSRIILAEQPGHRRSRCLAGAGQVPATDGDGGVRQVGPLRVYQGGRADAIDTAR